MTSLYAVLGDPIQHSLSPQIFKLFAEQTKQVLDYQAIQVKSEDLPFELRRLRSQGYRGVNLTAPLKEQAVLLADHCSEQAQVAKASNILTFKEDGLCYGHNSDGLGFIRDLVQNKSCTIVGKAILILGAGGAVRGLMAALLKENPGQVVICNRSEPRARQLIKDFQTQTQLLQFSSSLELPGRRFDLVIHCTTLGLQGESFPLPGGILNPGACCYDLSYGKSALPFLGWAKEQGATHGYDGLGMLVEQAAEAFYLWCQQRVDTKPVLHNLRAGLSK